MEMTLEQEFTQRVKAHMLGICFTAIENQLAYEIDHSTGINIPSFLLKDQIRAEVVERVEHAMANGTFNDLYNECYEQLQDIL